jgi:hypothetical protein
MLIAKYNPAGPPPRQAIFIVRPSSKLASATAAFAGMLYQNGIGAEQFQA